MAILFDGKRFAQEKEKELILRVQKLKKRKTVPNLETIIDGNNPASALYTKLKSLAAERIGANVNVYPIASQKRDKRTLIKSLISTLNKDESVHGIMLQLPLSESAKPYTQEFIRNINPKKDVDGLKEKSKFVPATVKAVIQIIDFAKIKTGLSRKNSDINVCVYGAAGQVGKPLVKYLKKLKYFVVPVDKILKKSEYESQDADILISATGKPGVITGKMVKEGAIIIDVGSPKGDVLFNEVVGKASFITPVPGGVGPVTIVCLLENLVEAAYNTTKRIPR